MRAATATRNDGNGDTVLELGLIMRQQTPSPGESVEQGTSVKILVAF